MESKRSRTTRQTQRKHKSVKRRVEKERIELPGTAQPSTGASSQGHDLQPPRTKKRRKLRPTLADTSEPRELTVTTGQASTLNVRIDDDDKTLVSCSKKTGEDPEFLNQQSEAVTATGTILDSHCEEQAIVEMEEKKVLIVSDTSMSPSGTVATPPESSRVTAEASKEEKYVKGTQEKSKSAQETPLKNGARAQDGSNHASSKKTVQRKRHKRTGRYGELFSHV